MKERTGYIGQDRSGKWFARITVTNRNGTRRNVKRRAKDKADAKEILKGLTRQIDDEGEKGIKAARMTFNDLANFYTKHYLIPAEYIDGRKIAGLRALDKPNICVRYFRAYFGNTKLREITYGDIYSYRAARFKSQTQFKKPPCISTMNRELVILRRMLNIAIQNGWLLKNPFKSGDALISPSGERRRERVLTLDEERRLLEACGERTITYKRNGKEITAHDKGESRAHLHAIIIALLDTGCRKGEVLQLRWRFVCFASRTITIEALTTKTLLTRKVGMTQRLFDELIALWEKSDKDLNALVFGITNNVTKAFMSACEASGVPYGSPNNITLHSLRHTAATRLVKGKMPLHIVGRILGHTQPQTTYRYLSADAEATAQAVSILEELQHEPADTSATVAQASELVN